MVLDEELARFDTPTTRPLGVGPNLAAGTILRDGTDDQKRRYLPPIARGEERWCQLFSEPDAGSDLASLRTRAEVDGDSWVVNGQKVWSSYAEGAAFALLLARTDADAPKPQAGITMFILPMTTEGVTVRPLVDMGGGRHFNEVFLEEVVLGPGLVIGEVNHGWGVANGTLGRERRFYMGGSGKGRRRRQAVELATRHGRLGEPSVRQAIASVHAAERMLEWLRDRLVESVVVGGHPAAGSMMKMAAGTLEQRVAELGAALAGMDAAAWDRADRDGDIVAHSLAVSRQATIAGGTHQIQRNILGERLLGLPR